MIVSIDTIVDGRIGVCHDAAYSFPVPAGSFATRWGIGVGAVVELSDNGLYIKRVLQPSPNGPPQRSVLAEDSVVFDNWFQFRSLLVPRIPHHIARALFLSGIQTLAALCTYIERPAPVPKIKGIGPVYIQKLRDFILEQQ